jgi:hypothetical protein
MTHHPTHCFRKPGICVECLFVRSSCDSDERIPFDRVLCCGFFFRMKTGCILSGSNNNEITCFASARSCAPSVAPDRQMPLQQHLLSSLLSSSISTCEGEQRPYQVAGLNVMHWARLTPQCDLWCRTLSLIAASAIATRS